VVSVNPIQWFGELRRNARWSDDGNARTCVCKATYSHDHALAQAIEIAVFFLLTEPVFVVNSGSYTEVRMSTRYMGVKKPGLSDKGCWVVVRGYSGSLFAQGGNCGCKPRPGHLTCRHHAQHETEAQRLSESLTPEKLEQRVTHWRDKLAALRAQPDRAGKGGPSARDQAIMSATRHLEYYEAALAEVQRRTG
jgi:hypothetical protein